MNKYINANEALLVLRGRIIASGEILMLSHKIKALNNVPFYIGNPQDTKISNIVIHTEPCWDLMPGKFISDLREDPESLHCIYTYNVNDLESISFRIIDKSVCMNINLNAIDLIDNFCNDQVAFAQLQKEVAEALGLGTGWAHYFIKLLYI